MKQKANMSAREQVNTAYIPAELRAFVERVLGGESKVSAWCAVKGCANDRTARSKASRAWKGKAVQSYVAELQSRAEAGETAPGGAGAIQLCQAEVERRSKLLGISQLSREAVVSWLTALVFTGADELLDSDGSVRAEFRPLVQSFERIPGPLGERIKVTMPNKLQALRELSEMLSYSEPIKIDLAPNHVAKKLLALRDTTGL